jgi:hypothetical protein
MLQNLAIAACAGLLAVIIWSFYAAYLRKQPRDNDQNHLQSSKQPEEEDPYQDIEPLPDFDWTVTRPIQNAKFKPKYHLTMGQYAFPD